MKITNIIPALFFILVSQMTYGQISVKIQEMQKMPNDTAKVEALIEIAKDYADGTLDSAYFYANQAEQLANQLNYTRGKIHVKMVYATEHFYKGEFPEAMTLLTEAIEDAEKNGYNRLIVGCKLLLGNVHAKQQNFDEALRSYRDGLAICQVTNNKETMASLYTSIGITKRLMGELDSALIYYEKVLVIQEEELHDSVTLAAVYNNIGSIYYYQGDYLTTEKYIQKALAINRATGNTRFELINLANLGAIWGESGGNLVKSIDYFNQAIVLAQERGEKETLSNFYREISQAYYKHGKFQNAYDHLLLANTYRDSVYGEKKQAQILELEAQYETRKIQDSLRMKEQDLDIALANEEAAEQKASKTVWQLIGSGVLTLFVLVILIFVYRNSKQQKRINQMLTEKNEEINQQKLIIEEKNTELTDSITYAKRIQTALLPSENSMKEVLGDHFLLFKPKDIVSGDFYWIKKNGSKKIFTVADCTGHGVPGAMVSMLGYDTLEKVVLNAPDSSAEFLNQVNHEMISALSSRDGQGENQIKDGMDIGLCSLEDYVLDFCGANNGCYIIRSSNLPVPENSDEMTITDHGDYKLIELKPNKRPIGFHHTEGDFQSLRIKVHPGDQIILFSDGYADQFGGDKGKKMKSSTFREILLKNASNSMAETHQELEAFLVNWMGSFDQLDDITVLGIVVD